MNAARRLLRVVLLGLALAWAQQATLLHALEHATHAPEGAPHPSQCAEHSAYVQLASGAATQPAAAAFVAALPPRIDARLAAGVALEPRLAFRAQAPPASAA